MGNRAYITLLVFVGTVLSFIPFIGWLVPLGLGIWFGIKGNTWAWQNKKWQSVEHFHAVQKNWAIAGLIVFLFFCVIIPIIILSLTMPVLMKDTTSLENSAQIKRAVNTVYESVLMSEALGNKCELSSEGLAKCFAERLNVNSINGAELRLSDSTEWKFTGNNSCLGAGECYITIDVNGIEGPNADGKDIVTIPLYAKSDGNLEIKREDLDKYMN